MSFINRKIIALNENNICRGEGFSIDINPSETNFRHDPYLKVYNKESYNSSDKVARIHFLKNYGYEKPHRGSKESTTFNNKELKTICELIRNNWDKVLKLYVDGCKIYGSERDKILKIPYPEELYNSLKN